MQKFIRFTRQNIFLFLSLIVPALLLGIIYASIGVFPFGSRSILISDLNTQYVDFFAAFRRIMLDGESPFYAWAKGLGGNFWGLFAYYLASPFSLITLLFPEAYLTEALTLVTLLKVGCAGLSMSLYLKFGRKAEGPELLLFSLPYALMAYVLVYSFNIMWLDGIILLPLVTLGIEKIVRGKSPWVYCLSLWLTLVTNYYIAYMVGLFALLYFVYFSLIQEERVSSKSWLRPAFSFFGASILSIGTAAFTLLPAYFSLSAGKMETNASWLTLTQNISWLDILSKSLFGAYDSGLGRFPNVYCGVGILFLALLFFGAKSIPIRRKLAAGLFLLFLLACFSTQGLNILWHGLQPPVSFLYRYSFLFSFLLVGLAYEAYRQSADSNVWRLLVIFCGGLILIGAAAVHGYDFMPPAVLLISGGLFILYFLIFLLLKRKPLFLSSVLLVVFLVELSANAWVFINGLDHENGLGYQERASYYKTGNQLLPVLSGIEKNDRDFYRVEKTFYRTYNDPLNLDYKGITHFSSSFDRPSLVFLKAAGLQQAGYQTIYRGATIPMDTLLDIKYILSLDGAINGYGEMSRNNGKLGEVVTNANPYALPLAFLVEPDLAALSIDDASPLVFQNRIFEAMTGSRDRPIFTPLTVQETRLVNLVQNEGDGTIRFSKEKPENDASLEYFLSAPDMNPIYLYLLTVGDSKAEVFVNGRSRGFFGENSENNYVIDLGRFKPGQKISIKLQLKRDTLTLQEGAPFYTLDMQRFSAVQKTLAANPLKITTYDDTSIDGQVDNPSGQQLLFTSIPYDEGWSVLVDGKENPKIILLDTFIGVYIPNGNHAVSFTYHLPGLWPGTIVSIFSLIVAIILYSLLWHPKKP